MTTEQTQQRESEAAVESIIETWEASVNALLGEATCRTPEIIRQYRQLTQAQIPDSAGIDLASRQHGLVKLVGMLQRALGNTLDKLDANTIGQWKRGEFAVMARECCDRANVTGKPYNLICNAVQEIAESVVKEREERGFKAA